MGLWYGTAVWSLTDLAPVAKYQLFWTVAVKFVACMDELKPMTWPAWWPLIHPNMSQAKTTRSKGQGKGSVSQLVESDAPSLDPEEREVLFKLAMEQALGDHQIQAKIKETVKAANQALLEIVSSLRDEVRSLRTAIADRDATITALQSELQLLQEDHDALEQYGRRNGLRISGLPEKENEDTTTAIVDLANEVLKVEPPLQREDISISHRLKKPRNARAQEPAPIIVRFLRRVDRNRVISERKKLKDYNQDQDIQIYLNEDLTTWRAKLFAKVRALQKKETFQTNLDLQWEYQGNVAKWRS